MCICAGRQWPGNFARSPLHSLSPSNSSPPPMLSLQKANDVFSVHTQNQPRNPWINIFCSQKRTLLFHMVAVVLATVVNLVGVGMFKLVQSAEVKLKYYARFNITCAGCWKYLCGLSSCALKSSSRKIVKSHHVKLGARTDVAQTHTRRHNFCFARWTWFVVRHRAHCATEHTKIKITLHAGLILMEAHSHGYWVLV